MRYSKPSGRRIYRGRFFLLVLAADGLDERRRLDGRAVAEVGRPRLQDIPAILNPRPINRPAYSIACVVRPRSRAKSCDANCCRVTEMIYRIRYLLLASVVGSASLRIVWPLALPPNACVISLEGEYSRGRGRNGHTERGQSQARLPFFDAGEVPQHYAADFKHWSSPYNSSIRRCLCSYSRLFPMFSVCHATEDFPP
jgi:hypothetical protein